MNVEILGPCSDDLSSSSESCASGVSLNGIQIIVNAHLKHRNHLNSINISLRAEPSCRDLVREACRGGTGEKRRKEGSILKVRQKPLLLRSDEVNSHWLKISVVSRITRPLYILAVKIFVARVQTQF